MSAHFDSEGKLILNGKPIKQTAAELPSTEEYIPEGKLFHCVCQIFIAAHDGEAVVKREIDLPFAPTIGLRIWFNERIDDTFEVEELNFFAAGPGRFELIEKDDAISTGLSIESLATDQVNLGWLLDDEINYMQVTDHESWPSRFFEVLDARSRNVLKQSGITTFCEFERALLDPRQASQWRGCGRKTLARLQKAYFIAMAERCSA